MVLMQRPFYLLLFSLTLLAVIAGSGALMALAGQGRDVLIFSAGVGVGMSLLAALSLELWKLLCAQITAMQTQVADVALSLQLGEIHPRLMLRPSATPDHASDSHLELECRRLLDRLHQLLEKAVDADGHCQYCDQWDTHTERCPVVAAQALYRAGKARRVPWREYKKRLSQDVV